MCSGYCALSWIRQSLQAAPFADPLLFTCVCTVFIDNEHLGFGSSAVRAKEERETGDSATRKIQTPIQGNVLLWDILEMLLLSEYVITLDRKYQHTYCPFSALPTCIW